MVSVANITGNSRQWYIGFSSNNNNNNTMPRGPVLMPAHLMPPMMSFSSCSWLLVLELSVGEVVVVVLAVYNVP